MSTNLRMQELEDSAREITLLRQQSIEDDKQFSGSSLLDREFTNHLEKISFDKITLGFVLGVLFFGITLVVNRSNPFLPFQADPLLTTITLMTSVFTLLSVRESKRDREASVAPTVFVGKQQGKYGIINLGKGPAHELTVKVKDECPTDWDDVDPKCNGQILRADDDFLSLQETRPKYVRFEYRSNLGYKEYNVTRKVLSSTGD